jgi:C4-dicarboxylate transporter DctM subunit
MTLMITVFLLLLLVNMPVAFCLLISAGAYIVLLGDLPLDLIVQQMFSGVDKFVFLAIPFFILSGIIMQKGGISDRLIVLSAALLDRVTGGFAMATQVASMFFSAISGSGPATTAAIGGAMLPTLEKKGYGKEWSVAYIAAAGTLGPIIPPSITLVIYGAMAGVSIGGLFIGSTIPGILIGLALMYLAYTRAKKMGIKRSEVKVDRAFMIKAWKDAFWALFMPILIIGGILGGIFTPTEAAVISVIYSLIVSFWIYRSMKLSDLPEIFLTTVITSAVIMILTANATTFAWILSAEQGPQQLIGWIQDTFHNKYMVLFVLNIFLLILGCFLDTTSALIITVPTMVMLANAVGIDQLHLGIIVGVNLSIGMATPPLGFTLFTACSIGKVSISDVFKPILPMIGVMVLCIFIITFFPQLYMWTVTMFD